MVPEAVMAVHGLVVRPLGRRQHPGVAQHVEQRIAPYLNSLALQPLAQHVLQFACTQLEVLTRVVTGTRVEKRDKGFL